MPVSVFQRNDIGVSAWITLAGMLKSLVIQGVAPLVLVSAFQRGQTVSVHRLIHRILVTALRSGQLSDVAIVRFGSFQPRCAI